MPARAGSTSRGEMTASPNPGTNPASRSGSGRRSPASSRSASRSIGARSSPSPARCSGGIEIGRRPETGAAPVYRPGGRALRDLPATPGDQVGARVRERRQQVGTAEGDDRDARAAGRVEPFDEGAEPGRDAHRARPAPPRARSSPRPRQRRPHRATPFDSTYVMYSIHSTSSKLRSTLLLGRIAVQVGRTESDDVRVRHPAVHRAHGAETRGSKGGRASPCQVAVFNTASAGSPAKAHQGLPASPWASPRGYPTQPFSHSIANDAARAGRREPFQSRALVGNRVAHPCGCLWRWRGVQPRLNCH